MIVTTIPNHPAPVYVSTPVFAVPTKLIRDTVYMPSAVAARLLNPVVRAEGSAGRALEAPSPRRR